jgi:hypothetical protein
MNFVQLKSLLRSALLVERNSQVSFRLRSAGDPGPSLRNQPRSDHCVRLGLELGVGVKLEFVPPSLDPRFDRIEREPPHLAVKFDVPPPCSFLCVALGPCGCSSCCHSFFVGWCSHDDASSIGSLWLEPTQGSDHCVGSLQSTKHQHSSRVFVRSASMFCC